MSGFLLQPETKAATETDKAQADYSEEAKPEENKVEEVVEEGQKN